MKRLNPVTGKPFVRGDTRADGFLFLKYKLTFPPKKDGYFRENWLSPEAFNRRRNYEYQPRGRAKNLLSGAKERAATKEGIVTITHEWITEKISKGVCEVTGLPFFLGATGGKGPNFLYAPSLDRIDSSNPNYSPDNVQVVLWGVNCLKNQYEFEDMLPIMKAIIAKM